MIYEDERTTDELVDEILGAGDGEQDEPTPETPDGSRWDIPGEGTERATCRRCGTIFLRPPKSRRTRKICPACFSAAVSAGRKAGHAKRVEIREKRKEMAEAAKAEAERRKETVEQDEKTQWDQLEETAAAPEREPEEDERVMLENVREKNDVIIDIYRTVRSIARSAGLDPSRTVEALYEMDSIMRGV